MLSLQKRMRWFPPPLDADGFGVKPGLCGLCVFCIFGFRVFLFLGKTECRHSRRHPCCTKVAEPGAGTSLLNKNKSGFGGPRICMRPHRDSTRHPKSPWPTPVAERIIKGTCQHLPGRERCRSRARPVTHRRPGRTHSGKYLKKGAAAVN